MKWFLIIPILLVLFIAGCTQQQTTSYVCPDGSTVSNPSLCPQTTPQPSQCPTQNFYCLTGSLATLKTSPQFIMLNNIKWTSNIIDDSICRVQFEKTILGNSNYFCWLKTIRVEGSQMSTSYPYVTEYNYDVDCFCYYA